MKKGIYILSFFLSLLLFFSSFANADPIEIWECKETYGSWDKILVRAVVEKGRKIGTVEVAGVKHNSGFAVKGFNRRWDFGLADDLTYNFAFIIQPNGDASYYDFSTESKAKPSIFMKCRQSK